VLVRLSGARALLGIPVKGIFVFKRKQGSIALAAIVALAAIGGVSVATSAIPSGDGSIHACYGSNGEVRVIDKEAGKTCKKGWTALSWNRQGVQDHQAYRVRQDRKVHMAATIRVTWRVLG
jgi:hypothetical protein